MVVPFIEDFWTVSDNNPGVDDDSTGVDNDSNMDVVESGRNQTHMKVKSNKQYHRLAAEKF